MTSATKTGSLQMELTTTLPNGLIVPAAFSVSYPDGMGFHAVAAVQKMFSDRMDEILTELQERGDSSLLTSLAEANAEDQVIEDEAPAGQDVAAGE